MKNISDYQNEILTDLYREQRTFTMFLMNGYQLRGTLSAFDNFVLVVEVDGRQQMIYKHAISTISPHYSVELTA